VNWNSNYTNNNDYYRGNAAELGLWDVTACNFDVLKSYTGGDANSFDYIPNFTDAPNCNLAINPADACAFNSTSELIAAVTTDFLGVMRGTYPDLGAYEFTPTNGDSYNVWQGWNDTAWETNSNWSCEVVPNSLTSILIPHVANKPVINSAVEINQLKVETSSVLTVSPLSSLSVLGNLTVNGNIKLKTPANTNPQGSLIVIGTIAGSGTATIERYYNVAAKWQYTTVPFSNVYSTSFTSPGFNPNFYSYSESFDLSPNPTGALYEHWTDLEAAWQDAHNGKEGAAMLLSKGAGYSFYNENNKQINYQNIVTDIENSDLTFNLTFTANDGNSDYFDGWNLLGNPYPSAIDWDNFAKTNIQNTVYYWDSEAQKYKYYNGFGATETGDGSNVVNGGSQFIPSLQAFFVKATGSGTLTVPRAARAHSNQPIWKKSVYGENNSIPFFKLLAKNHLSSDELSIRFIEDASANFDPEFDAYKVYSSEQINLFSVSNNIPFALNSYPKLDTAMVVPFVFMAAKPGKYSIEISAAEIPENIPIYLEDVNNYTFTELKKNSYSFEYKKSKEPKKFNIHFSKPSFLAAVEDISIFSFENLITVHSPDTVSRMDITVYNLIGQELLKTSYLSNSARIETQLETGIYLVKVEAAGKLTFKKVYLN
ncbi:MAG TPA: hypothetical protein DCQ31_15000, partial [Bacteroidales bacterium]|nr:hypothetical protein [Bacteroidales bacterium]